MKKDHLPLLVCPKTKRPLELKVVKTGSDDRVEEGVLIEPISGNEYPIVNYIPRFVPRENYANSFGFQWNLHWQTQQDEYAKVDVSGTRFFHETKWGKDLKGQVMLEAGCGAGRFTRHAVSTKAMVISFDYSNAVDANYKVNGGFENLLLLQADIFNMPFSENYFDKVFCFGVLQHTPDPEKAFYSLVNHLKPGGKIATDIYLKSWKNYFHVKPYVRAFVKKLAPESLYKFTKKYVNFFWPVARIARRSKVGQKLISRFVAERSDQLGKADDKLIREWAYLDTFDWFSPAFDQPKRLKEFKAWHHRAKLQNVEVHYGFNGIEARATKSV
jgi:SAM-dependent methyltransferase